MKRANPDSPPRCHSHQGKGGLPLGFAVHGMSEKGGDGRIDTSRLGSMMAEAGVIMDGELDDLVTLRLTKNRGTWLAVYTLDKDGMGISHKTRMTRAVSGRMADYEVWMANDYKRSPDENRRENERILRGPAGDSVRAFAESLLPAFDKWGFAILILTAPSFGIVDKIHQCLGGRELVVLLYSGSYNLAHMQDVVALSKCRLGGAYIVDTSAFHALGGGKDSRLARLANFRTLFEGTSFWDELKERRPERYHAIREFLLHFNVELVRPGRLLLPEHADKAAELAGEYDAIFWQGPGSIGIPQLAQYLLTVSTNYDPYIKPFKRSMVQGPEALMTDAALCDLLLAVPNHLAPAQVEFTYGEWVVERFSRVDPKGERFNAATWRLRCAANPAATDSEVAAVVDRITALVRDALLED